MVKRLFIAKINVFFSKCTFYTNWAVFLRWQLLKVAGKYGG